MLHEEQLIGPDLLRIWLRSKILSLILSIFTFALVILLTVSPALVLERERLTNYPHFEEVCYAFMQNDIGSNRAIPLMPNGESATCKQQRKPILFSVTHENSDNNHTGAKNNDPKLSAYMADFNLVRDLGRWLNVQFNNRAPVILTMGLDTKGYTTNETTGWPLEYGHLFFSMHDSMIRAVDLDKNIFVEFDFNFQHIPAGNDSRSSGARAMVGARVDWQEDRRSNNVHFAEFDVTFTEGYAATFRERSPSPACDERKFNRCFYDKNGKYAEGREYKWSCGNPDAEGWVRCRLPLSQYVRNAGWFSPPSNWKDAVVRSVYIGLESTGAATSVLKVRNYNLFLIAVP